MPELPEIETIKSVIEPQIQGTAIKNIIVSRPEIIAYPTAGEFTTAEDIPIEIYWCIYCKTPIIQNTTQADKGICPLCGEKMKYLSADFRPVFPEERWLVELLLYKGPNEFIKKSVWVSNSRYYIDGKSIPITSKTFQLADTDSLINIIS